MTNPKTYDFPNEEKFEGLRNLLDEGVWICLHSPYLVNFVRSNRETLVFTIRYIEALLRGLRGRKIPLVFHTGWSTRDRVRDIGVMATMLERIKGLLEGRGYKDWSILLENAPGWREGSGSTSVEGIVEVLNKVGDVRFGLTLDTEHAFADGKDLKEGYSEEVWKWVGLVHLNGIPSEVKRGSHLDRHSLTLLEDSCVDKTFIKVCLEEAYTRGVRIILERSDYGLIEKDIKYCFPLYQELVNGLGR